MKVKLLFIFALLLTAVTGAWADFTPQEGDVWDEATKTLTVNSNPDEYSYSGNDEIQHLVIASGVTTIGDGAFRECTGLMTVTIPASVTYIGYDAFYVCTEVTDVYCDADPAALTWDEGGCDDFKYDGTTIIHVADAGSWYAKFAGVVNGIFRDPSTIPFTWAYNPDTKTLTLSGTETIPSYRDSNDRPWNDKISEIKNIVIEDGVKGIGKNAFQDCTGLTSVTFASGSQLTSIGDGAFYHCSSLPSITIPASVTSIGNSAFSACSSLATMIVEDGNPEYDSRNSCNAIIEKSTNTLIAGCKSTTIPASVTSIGNNAFYYCDGLTSITIPANVTSIGNNAFEYCTGLTSITIPASVTSIGNNAFAGSALTSITIPASVTSIGESAFGYCSSLATMTVEDGNEVYDSRNSCNAIIEKSTNTLIAGCKGTTIPASVTSIGDYAFCYCTGLTTITIPASVTSIGYYAFYNCSNLTSVTVNAPSCTLGYGAFNECNKLESIYVPSDKADQYRTDWSDYSDKITVLEDGDCGTTVTWKLALTSASGVLTISGTGAMADYDDPSGQPWKDYRSSITSVVIEDGVTSIGKNAFADCTGLTSVTVYALDCTLGDNAFGGCTSLESIYVFSDLVDDYKDAWSTYASIVKEMPNPHGTCGAAGHEADVRWVLTGTSPNYTLTISGTGAMVDYDDYDKVPWYSSYAGEISTVVIKDGVTSIGDYAFSYCDGLTFITIPASVTSIGNNAFEYCSSLPSITIPASVTSIGNSAFSACSSLATMIVEDGNPEYDSRNSCNAIIETKTNTLIAGCKNTIIPDDVTSIGDGAFKGSGLTTITIPASVTSIGKNAFEECYNLATVTFDGTPTLTSIGNYAFYYCDGLTTITIPASVTSIGDYAFNNCSNLPSITIPASVKFIGNGAFCVCSALTSITIPASVKSIGEWAFQDCSNLATVTLNSYPYIGYGAFYGIASDATVTMNLTAHEGATGEYWMTFYNDYYNFEADANTKVFKAELSDNSLTLTELKDDKIVPSGNAVILKSTSSSIMMTLTETDSNNDFSDNWLAGVWDPAGLESDGNYYVLNKGAQGVGFYKLADGSTLGYGKAYLWYNGSSSSSFFGFDETTGVNEVRGQMEDVRGEYYDLQGRRVAQPTKGLYIVNGKKVVIK